MPRLKVILDPAALHCLEIQVNQGCQLLVSWSTILAWVLQRREQEDRYTNISASHCPVNLCLDVLNSGAEKISTSSSCQAVTSSAEEQITRKALPNPETGRSKTQKHQRLLHNFSADLITIIDSRVSQSLPWTARNTYFCHGNAVVVVVAGVVVVLSEI